MSDTRSIRTTRCSLVVSPVDIWTRKLPAPSSLTVSLVGVERKPVRKPDGTYLFLDLPVDRYLLNIHSPSFIPVNQWIETGLLNPLHPVVTVPLLPGPGYLYPAASTALWFRLVGTCGTARPEVDVIAYAKEDAAARGRLAQELAAAGDCSIAVSLLQGQTVAGESLMLRGQGKQELVRVAEVLPGGIWRLEQPLEQSFKRGAALLPAVHTRSTAAGHVLLPFRGLLPSSFAVVVLADSTEHEWTLRSGEVKEIPPITV